MDKDSIIRMARDCGFDDYEQDAMLEGFAALVAKAEREECAKLCDELAGHCWVNEDDGNAESCAKAIRAKGQS